MGRKLTQEEFIKKLRIKFPNDTLELMDDYKNKRTKVMIKHGECGRIIDTRTAGNWLHTAISPCPFCNDPRNKPLEEFLKEIDEHSKNTLKYIKGFEHKNGSNIKLQCLKCSNIFEKTQQNIKRNIKRNGSICPYCSKLRNLSTEEFNNKLLQETDNNYSIFGEYNNVSTRINVIHSKCGKITKSITPKRALRGLCCNHCYPRSSSYKERFIIDILDKNSIEYTREKIFNDLKSSGGYSLRFDFCLFKENDIILIEYDGEHHSNEEGYLSNNTVKNDKIKNDYCYNNNIKLYRIKDCSDEDLEIKINSILSETELS